MKKLFYTLSVAVLTPFLVEGQTYSENFVKSTIYRVETQTGNVPNDSKVESITYFDGLGRPIEAVSQRTGGSREDLITPIYYDNIGRKTKDWLPLPVFGNNGDYHTGTGGLTITQELKEYYPDKFPKDFYSGSGYIPDYDNPYSEKVLEASPLNRIIEQGAPGFDWHILYNDHSVKFEYLTNSANEVRKFSVGLTKSGYSYIPDLEYDGYYSEGQLSKSVIKDENWVANSIFGITYEYTNKKGQVVLKRKSVKDPNKGTEDPNYHDTYYIYDDLGNLTFVLSPEASEAIIVSGALATTYQTILNDLGYQYIYDYRNRLTDKRGPSRLDWDIIVYDRLDRPVLTQTPNLRNDGNKWMFTKYDKLGRVAYTGILSGFTRAQAESGAKSLALPIYENRTGQTTISGTTVYYTNQAFPTTNIEVHTVNYYDAYIDTGTLASLPSTNAYGKTISAATKGLPTVSKVRVLVTGGTQYWITSQKGYDEFGRTIYIASENPYLNTSDVLESLLDFTGNPIETKTEHTITGINANSITTYDYFTYDHIGRPISHEQKVEDESIQLISKKHYDELGQLIKKDVGGETYVDGYTDLDDVSVTFEGTVEKIGTTTGWNSGLKTRGAIVASTDGGISAKVVTTNKKMKFGLYKASQQLVPYDYLQYGIVATGQLVSGSNYALKFVLGITEYTTTATYTNGDVLAVERVGSNIVLSKNGTPFRTITNAIVDALVGKAHFYDLGAKIEEFHLYGDTIDKILQVVDYSYNVRGWLTDINDIEESSMIISNDLFKFRINYNKVDGNNNGTPMFNGNIAQTLWKSLNTNKDIRAYNFSYDNLSRIKEAISYQGTTIAQMVNPTNTYNVDDIEYDMNGNIQSLSRIGSNLDQSTVDSWDDLTYYYDSGNKLLNVLENSTSTLKDQGFFDGNNQQSTSLDDYLYDANGNMIKDLNKNITSITYNHLDLPVSITIGNGTVGGVGYIYDAVGTKLKKTIVQSGQTDIVTKYALGYIYQNDVLQFFPHSEGYVQYVSDDPDPLQEFKDGDMVTVSYAYVFQYLDHLGNVRLSYSDLEKNGVINPNDDEIVEESHYYPFGLKQWGYNYDFGGGNPLAQQWKYNNTELNDALGISLYEMDLRMHDPALGRWNSFDPVTHFSQSPYNGFDNNPILWADPSGADVEINRGMPTGSFIGWNNCANCGYAGGGSGDGLVGDPTKDIWISQGDGSYQNNRTGDITTDWKMAIRETSSTILSVNFAQLRNFIYEELGLNSSSLDKGTLIVNTFIAHLYLDTYFKTLIKVAFELGKSDSIDFNNYRPVAPIPDGAYRSRDNSGRNKLAENRDYGSVEFDSDYKVISTTPLAHKDYGYLYASGINVMFNSMDSDNLMYDSYNPYPGDNTFNGYAYIEFKDYNKLRVGELLFRTIQLKDDFVDYFKRVGEQFRQSILEKYGN